MIKRTISVLIALGLVVGLTLPTRQTHNKILLSNGATNFTQQLINICHYNGIIESNNLSTGQALIDCYIELQGKEGNISTEEYNKVYNSIKNNPSINTLSSGELNALVYLIAKGIITYPENLGTLIFQPLPSNLASNILSRIANPSSRLKFTPNTDGYTKTQIKIANTDVIPKVTTTITGGSGYHINLESKTMSVGGWQPGQVTSNNITLLANDTQPGGIIVPGATYGNPGGGNILPGSNKNDLNNQNKVQNAKNNNVLYTAGLTQANPTLTTYTITRTFDTQNGVVNYFYFGKPIKVGATGHGLVSVTKDKDNDLTAVFKVEGESSVQAIADLNANTSYQDRNGSIQYTYIPAITKVGAGGKVTTYIPQSSIRAMNGELQILDGMYLRNDKTGAEALFLKNSHIAILGNEVLKYNMPMTLTIGNELYYNFDIIDKLLSNAYLGDLTGDNTVYFSNALQDQKTYKVVSKGSDNVIQNALVYQVKNLQEYAKGIPTPNFYGQNIPVVNDTQLTRATDQLIFQVPEGNGNNYTVLVNFNMDLPKSLKINTDNLTLSDINAMYYNPPSDKTLDAWWQQNITIDNLIANYAYGTKNTKYFQCGYLVPKITILGDKVLTSKQIDSALESIGIPTPSQYFNKPVTDTSNSIELLEQQRTAVSWGMSAKKYGFEQYGPSYISNQVGTIYEALKTPVVGSDNKVSLQITNPQISSIDESNSTISMITRSQGKDIKEQPVGFVPEATKVLLYGKEWMCNGTIKMNGKTYYKLVYPTPVKGKISDGKFTLTGYPSMLDYIEKNLMVDHLYDINKGYATQLSSNMEYELPSKASYNGYVYTDKGVIKDYNSSNANSEKPVNGWQKLNVDGVAYPTLYLDSSYYKAMRVTSNPKDPIILSNGSEQVVQQLPNLFLRGVNQGVIDSIVAHNFGYKTFNQLPYGARVRIGDLDFTQVDGQLVSDPTTLDANDWNSKTVKSPEGIIGSMFAGINIANGIGAYTPFTSYITNAGFGPEIFGTDYSSFKNGVLFNYGGKLVVQSPEHITTPNADEIGSIVGNSQFTEYKGGKVGSAIIAITVSPSILFREVGSGEYALVCYTSQIGPGVINNSNLFNNNISGPNMFIFNTIGKSTFSPVSDAQKLINYNLEMMRKSQVTNLFDQLQIIVADLLAFGIVWLFMIWIIQKIGLFEDNLRRIKQEGIDQKGKGFDLWKVLSANIFSVDEGTHVLRFFVVEFSLYLLLTLVMQYSMTGSFLMPI